MHDTGTPSPPPSVSSLVDSVAVGAPVRMLFGPGKTLVKVRAKVLPMRLAQISKIQNPLPKRLSLYSLAKPNKRTAKNTHCADHKIPAASKIQTLQAICRSLSFAYNVVGIAMSNWRRVTITR